MARKINTNKMVALLAVLCMITSAFVGSTLAKYTTSANGADTARVAKFGVTLSVSNAGDKTGFATEYATSDSDYSGSLSVKADGTSAEQKLVAPGTKSVAPVVFKINGQPEVATKIDIVMSNVKDIKLPAGTYTDYTVQSKDGTYETSFTLSEDYYPVKFTLTQTKDYAGNSVGVVKEGTLEEIAKYLKNEYTDKNDVSSYAPNAILNSEYELTWEWAFDNTSTVANANKADTLLGNVIAGTYTESGAVTDLAYDIEFTVTQID